MHALRVAIQSLLCPCVKVLAGVATSAAETDQHAKSFLHRRLHVPLNALTSTIVLSRPITVLVMMLWALAAALLSVVTAATGWQPLGCPVADTEPRTRPRPPRREESREGKGPHERKRSLSSISMSIASSSKGWLGLAKRPARAPLSSPPHTVRLKSMTFHDLEGVEEYSEGEDEDTEMESMIADDQTESDGPSEVDTVSDVAPLGVEAVSRKGKGLFRRRPKRAVSESSIEGTEGEGASIAKSGSGSSSSSPPISLKFPKACPKARLRKAAARKASQTSSQDPPSPSSSYIFPATPSTSSSSQPTVGRPPLRNSHSSPTLPLTAEPESYDVPPRAAEAPVISLSVPSSAPARRGFATMFAKTSLKSRSWDRSPLSSPPMSPQLSPRIPPATLPPPALVSKPKGRSSSPGAPDATGRSGLALSDLVGRTRR